MSFHVPNENRLRTGELATDDVDGNNGAFFIPFKHYKSGLARRGKGLWIIASDGMGWEHVSVSAPSRCPSWSEMCRIKDIFWDAEDTVIQYHPARSRYVNTHPHTLHLWRPIEQTVPLPDPVLIGVLDGKRL